MKLRLVRLLPNLAGLFLAAFGLIVLAWVSWLTWYDVITWGKDIAFIFFGSRAGEAISLGIGMKVIYYFLIGLALLLSGLVTFLQRGSRAVKLHRSLFLRAQAREEKKKEESPVEPQEREEVSSKCPHYFGYLASRSKNAPIPQECLICPRLAACMVTTARA